MARKPFSEIKETETILLTPDSGEDWETFYKRYVSVALAGTEERDIPYEIFLYYVIKRARDAWIATHPRIKSVYLFPNGMIMTFDTNGQQMPEYQGMIGDVGERLATVYPMEKWQHGKMRKG